MTKSLMKDEQLVVEMSKDKMYGIISYSAPEGDGRALSLEEVIGLIKHKGIVFGVDECAIKESFESRRYDYRYIIAKGIAPVQGEPATLTFHFDMDHIGKGIPKKKEDGTVDFKELGLIINVKQGEVLVTKTPATDGRAGKNVLGQVVVATRGKDVKMPRGKNTELSEEGLTLRASIDGQMSYDHDVVSVAPHYIIKTDVDSSVGNVDFVGNIIINGGVQSGYTIRSGGTVEIRGPVEAATIIAEGDIILWYGIQGGDKGKLIAKGNIITKFIQNASVHAGRDVISEAIMHSDVAAGGNVMVDQGKGLVVGGTITAGRGIYTNTLGSYMATVTVLQLGQLPDTVERYKQLEQKYMALKDQCFKTDQNVSFLKLKGLKGLTPDKQQLLEQVLVMQTQLKLELEDTQKAYQELRDMMQDTDSGIIKVRNTVYPGVRVTIGNTIKYFVEQTQFCSINKIQGEIIISAY